ncbi:MAG: PepSY-associated TM helix domain-containing protein [Rhizonema sp. PD37]|nr:PepSY-associated TM helix domain-containing protein [Rhizonema sp. PD37]
MHSKKLRDFVFRLHRYIGLAVGFIVLIIGLTGSLLVFHSEISDLHLHRQIGKITPLGERLPVEVILETVKKAYANQPDVTIDRIYISAKPNTPATVVPRFKDTDLASLYVNPYNGVILGNSQEIFTERFFQVVYELHYSLLSGKTGNAIAGIVGLLMCILSVSGIILWPGWRKLPNGYSLRTKNYSIA